MELLVEEEEEQVENDLNNEEGGETETEGANQQASTAPGPRRIQGTAFTPMLKLLRLT